MNVTHAKQIQELETAQQSYQHQREENIKQIQTLQGQLTQLVSEHESLKEIHRQCPSQLNAAQQQLYDANASNQAAIQQLQADNSSKDQQLQQLQQQLTTANEANVVSDAELQALHSQMETNNAVHSRLEVTQTTNAHLRQQYAQLKAAYDKQHREFQTSQQFTTTRESMQAKMAQQAEAAAKYRDIHDKAEHNVSLDAVPAKTRVQTKANRMARLKKRREQKQKSHHKGETFHLPKEESRNGSVVEESWDERRDRAVIQATTDVQNAGAAIQATTDVQKAGAAIQATTGVQKAGAVIQATTGVQNAGADTTQRNDALKKRGITDVTTPMMQHKEKILRTRAPVDTSTNEATLQEHPEDNMAAVAEVSDIHSNPHDQQNSDLSDSDLSDL